MRMSDLAATFDAHVQAEFQDLDLEATMATMTDDPYVHHVPTITGGNGTADVRDFYGHHFIGQWPDNTEIQPISRTVGQDQVVDELHITFTHDRVLDIMLPGINPTGRRIAVPVGLIPGSMMSSTRSWVKVMCRRGLWWTKPARRTRSLPAQARDCATSRPETAAPGRTHCSFARFPTVSGY